MLNNTTKLKLTVQAKILSVRYTTMYILKYICYICYVIDKYIVRILLPDTGLIHIKYLLFLLYKNRTKFSPGSI